MFVSNALVKDTEEEEMTKCCDFQNYNLQFLLFCSFLPRLLSHPFRPLYVEVTRTHTGQKHR